MFLLLGYVFCQAQEIKPQVQETPSRKGSDGCLDREIGQNSSTKAEFYYFCRSFKAVIKPWE